MNTHTRAKTGFGIADTRHKVAARARRAAEKFEYPPRPPMKLTPENEKLIDLFIYARQFKRPLAA